MTRLLVIGLDCAEPGLLFDEFLPDLPNVKGIIDRGVHGRLRSTIPAITVPAWASMMTSKDPGMLGCYGFRNRKSHGYDDLFTANASHVHDKKIWNLLSRERLTSLIMGVPLTYPPAPLNGIMVADFLTPDKSVKWTFPAQVAAEVDRAAGGDYQFDVTGFRTDAKASLLERIFTMTIRRFAAFRHFLRKENPDFAMVVEMGVDRIHHGFWHFMDRRHRLHEPHNRFQGAIRQYYREIDRQIGLTLDTVGPAASVMIVSDHGAKASAGSVCINEWLRRQGYLVLREEPAAPAFLTPDLVDWSRTRAWGEGGYFSRIFFNVRGREPQGVLAENEVPRFKDEIQSALEAMDDPRGAPLNNVVFRPEEIYRAVRRIAPDLFVYLGDLGWRSSAVVGCGSLYRFEDDMGPDSANHAQDGVLAWSVPRPARARQSDVYSIFDVAPSILSFLGVKPPADMIGSSILEPERTHDAPG